MTPTGITLEIVAGNTRLRVDCPEARHGFTIIESLPTATPKPATLALLRKQGRDYLRQWPALRFVDAIAGETYLPEPIYSYGSRSFKTFAGLQAAIVRRWGAGTISLTMTAPGRVTITEDGAKLNPQPYHRTGSLHLARLDGHRASFPASFNVDESRIDIATFPDSRSHGFGDRKECAA